MPKILNVKIKHAVAGIGDTHFGSIYSPMHKFRTFDGRVIFPSKEQHKLNLIFDKCLTWLDFWQVDKILLGGDLVQGSNYKDRGRDLVTANLDEQRDMAIEYLSPLKDRGLSPIVISGTNYHKSQDTEIEERIAKDLNGKFYDKMCWLTFPDSERIINLSHQSVKSRIYPVGACEREATTMLKSYASEELPHKPDILWRFHQHIYAHVDRLAYHFILNPSFQTWYPFQTDYYGATQPNIGIVILFIDELDVIHVHHYTGDIRKIRIGDKTHEI
jgi:hypothetical protein